MVERRSRSGEYVAAGCLLSPGVGLLLLALVLPSNGHGNFLFIFLGFVALAAAGLILFLQAIVPKPPEPPESPPPSA
jgi:hypothetical protein